MPPPGKTEAAAVHRGEKKDESFHGRHSPRWRSPWGWAPVMPLVKVLSPVLTEQTAPAPLTSEAHRERAELTLALIVQKAARA